MLIFENNLFKVPVFKQKVPRTDFLLVRVANPSPKDPKNRDSNNNN